MKAATIIVISVALFFLAQEGKAAITAEKFWTTKIAGSPTIQTRISQDDLQKAFQDHNYERVTGETALNAADRVDRADAGGDDDNCEFGAFSKLASDPNDNIHKFLQQLN